jgi:GlcNAc-P-P-Und epimerase
MRVLVTGIAGLIGRWTAEALHREGDEVIGLDRLPLGEDIPCAEHYRCDLLDGDAVRQALRKSKPDAVIHLAARTDLAETRRLEGYAANIDGVRLLIEAIRSTPSVQRSVFTSSQLVCRVGHIPRTMEEYCPNTLYGQSKVLTERIVRKTEGGGREWVLVRPTTVWGPHMNRHYRRMLQLIQKGYYFHCGRGRLLKSYAYAGNIASQYVSLLRAPTERVAGRCFYLADYDPLSLRDYANALAVGLGAPLIRTYPLPVVRSMATVGDGLNALGWRQFPFNTFRLGNILSEYVFDLTETEAACGRLPYRWEEGVEATCSWFRSLTPDG